MLSHLAGIIIIIVQ